MERRVISTQIQEEDIKNEKTLRPLTLDEYIGQEKIKQNLRVFIQAAKQRGEALDHVLFYGPPGLGKTTLAGIIANEMGVHLKVTSGPAHWKARRNGGYSEQSSGGGPPFYRRDTQAEQTGGGSTLSGNGGFRH